MIKMIQNHIKNAFHRRILVANQSSYINNFANNNICKLPFCDQLHKQFTNNKLNIIKHNFMKKIVKHRQWSPNELTIKKKAFFFLTQWPFFTTNYTNLLQKLKNISNTKMKHTHTKNLQKQPFCCVWVKTTKKKCELCDRTILTYSRRNVCIYDLSFLQLFEEESSNPQWIFTWT
jgi:hypothetical protein